LPVNLVVLLFPPGSSVKLLENFLGLLGLLAFSTDPPPPQSIDRGVFS
jgi:hypothetical protein